VAGLLLAHASARTKEIALRAALGAGRGRLVRQLLSESLAMALAGCIAGCLLAYVGLKSLTLLPLNELLPMEAAITLNRPVLMFAVGISLVATILCGLAPALHAIRGDLQKSLASTGVNVNAAFQHSRFRSGLVIGQVALSLLLLTGAGLVARSFLALIRVDLGIRPEHIFTAEVHFPKGRYTKAQEKTAFISRLLTQLNSVPSVVNSTEMIGMPLFGGPEGDVTIPGKPHREPWRTGVQLCSEGYFETFGLHLLRGRLLTDSDILSARKVAVVNENLARKYFGGEDPIGRVIKFNVMDEVPETPHDAYFEIVGVVGNDRDIGFEGGMPVLREAGMALPAGFVPYSVSGFGDRTVALHTRVPAVSLVNNVRQVVWSLDHDVVLVAPDVGGATFSLADVLGAVIYDKPKFAAIGFTACALLGFALAIVGLFSVMTYIVSLKTHDIGIRLALGAPRAVILQMMVKRGLVLIGSGILIGLLASLGLTRFLSSQLRGISAYDPFTFGVVVVTVLLAGTSACFFPAHRATTVDPMATLREE
jgi:putative ABC transport system permease protein